ncbi:hypothetical protein [Halomonas salifodinae]|uniref:hypothetical protein n=1 Tax=Halomonas salifodinae TaxID=438745 RepID=UPI0033B3C25D
MNEGKIGKRHSQTFFTSGAGMISTALSTTLLPEHHVQTGIYIGLIAAPFISMLLTKIYNNLNEAEELIAYKRGLKKDIKTLKKLLNDKHLSDEQKKVHQESYQETCLKLSQANTRFYQGDLSLRPVKSTL